jgi:hypothetical protein
MSNLWKASRRAQKKDSSSEVVKLDLASRVTRLSPSGRVVTLESFYLQNFHGKGYVLPNFDKMGWATV